MAVQSSFYGTNGELVTFPQTKHIQNKDYVRVFVRKIEDNSWILYDATKYDVINNSIVFDSPIDAKLYNMVEIRVADSVDELSDTLSDIAIVASNIVNVNTVAENIDDVNNFGKVYYGSLASNPTTRPDGAAIQSGDLYFNSTNKEMRVYDGLEWKDLSSLYKENVISINTITELLSFSVKADGIKISVSGYHTINDDGGGIFLWDSSEDKANHNGGTIIDPDKIFPSDWTDQTALVTWFTGDGIGTGCWKRVYDSVVNVKWFGAKGDGLSDDTVSIQNALNYTASARVDVIGRGTFKVRTLNITSGATIVDIYEIKSSGTTNPNNLNTEAVVVLQGDLTGGTTPVENAIIKLKIDMSGGDRTAILADGSNYCVFENCYIYNFIDDTTYNHRGIRIQEGGSNNIVRNNFIRGVKNPTQRGLLVDIWAKLATLPAYGGFFDGLTLRAPDPAIGNVVNNNSFIDGSYAINLQGAELTKFTNNYCYNQNHRGVYVANGAYKNSITNNTIIDFLSSGILLGYGAHENIVSNNTIKQENIAQGGEAAINIITGAENNKIVGNTIYSGTNYGIYVATDSSGCVIDGNVVYNFYLAGIAVENDWIQTRPTNAIYSRPNYAPPTDIDPTYTSWTYRGISNITISNNVIGSGYSFRNTGAIYIAQIENDAVGAVATMVSDIVICGNTISKYENMLDVVLVYKHTSGISNIRFSDMNYPEVTPLSAFRSATPVGNVNFVDVGITEIRNSGLFTQKERERYIPLVGATPIVAGSLADNAYYFNNTAATTVTDFLDGYEGQEIVIRLDTNTTIQYNSATIRTKGSVDVTPTNSNNFICFKFIAGIWFELWRSF